MLKGYRTLIFNGIMTIIMVLKMWKPETEVPGVEEIEGGIDAVEGAITFVWGLGNLILRAITNTSIGKAE